MRQGKPPQNEYHLFNRVEVDDIEVFMPKTLFIPGNFSIALWKFLWLKGLTVEDWKLV